MNIGDLLRGWRSVGPSENPGQPCAECGAVLVLCVQCGVKSRCVSCCPYEWSSARKEEEYRLVRLVRDRPEAGLLVGALAALVPAVFLWAGAAFAAAGLVRTVGIVAGTVAVLAFLAMGAALRKLPLPGEVPACRRDDRTPYDWWEQTGVVMLLAQIALVAVGITSGQ